jgi:DNA-binding transcriptional LysR family regulator
MRDLNVDQIKKLWVLDLIIQTGSLKKAALQAKVSPSAISQSLSSLERATGRPLLIRENGSITPTPEALSILEMIRPAFAAFDRLNDAHGAEAPKMSWLNFGTYESIAIDLLPGLIRSLRQQLPSCRLSLRISRTSHLLTMVRKGELCSALITEVDDLERFYVREVVEDRLGLFVAKRHPIAQAGWEALDQFGFGSLTPGKDGLPRYFQKYVRQLETHSPLVLSDSFEALREACLAGVMVAVLPARVANRTEGLMELIPPRGRMKENGKHKICVVSLANCDREETDFLADQARRILQK